MLRLTAEARTERALGFFGEMRRSITDLRPLYEEVLEPAFYADREQDFASQGARVGGWRELEANYRRWKAIHYPGKPILQLTGALKTSFTKQGAQGQVRRIDERTMTIGSNVVYANRQDWRRPVIVHGSADDTAWSRMCDDYYRRRLADGAV